MVVPGSTPPVPSVTDPLMSPVVRCANDERGKAETAASVRQATQRRCDMEGGPSKFARGTATRKLCERFVSCAGAEVNTTARVRRVAWARQIGKSGRLEIRPARPANLPDVPDLPDPRSARRRGALLQSVEARRACNHRAAMIV